MTRPSPFAHIPDEFMDKVKAYSGAHVANWVPQLQVLAHPVRTLTRTHNESEYRLMILY